MEDRLQKFAYLIDAGSFTRAAKELHISQPALSMAMQKLERELGAVLYVRNSQPLAPTDAGGRAYKSAKELTASLRNLRTALSELSQQEIALAIGVIDSVADSMLANRRTIGMLESQAKVSLVINNSRYLLQALERSEIDVAIIAEQGHASDNRLQYEHIAAEPLIIVVHKARYAVVQQELADAVLTSFISYDQPSRTHTMIARSFEQRGVTLSPQFFSSSPDVILRLLLAKKGAAALPYRKARPYIRSGRIVPIGNAAVVQRPITMVCRRNYQMPQILHKLMPRLRQDLSTLLDEATIACS